MQKISFIFFGNTATCCANGTSITLLFPKIYKFKVASLKIQAEGRSAAKFYEKKKFIKSILNAELSLEAVIFVNGSNHQL